MIVKMRSRGMFVGRLRLEAEIDGRLWRLLEPFAYWTSGGKKIDVPEGYQTDGASIPRILWRIVGPPMTGPYRRAAVIHDWTHENARKGRLGYTFDWSNRVFLEAMEVDGVGWIKRRAMYLGVSIYCWFVKVEPSK